MRQAPELPDRLPGDRLIRHIMKTSKNTTKMKVKLLLFFVSLSFHTFLAAQQATLTGVVTDETKDFLPGATVSVKGTTKGTATDANGRYTLLGVPTGKQVIRISFLGYETQWIEITLKAGETRILHVAMVPASILKNEVVVTAQARGQTAAIGRQLAATGIMNAISGEKLNELPDVNVADAIGRLPGLMVQRDGGEGQKIIIRGLDPKYNTVAINGMNAPSTSSGDRSTDLNMISPEMIGGAEVLKANTADKDADGLGGTVNLIMKDAPAGFRLSVNGQTGYHSQIENIGHFKGNILASNRFFNNRLGLIFTASAEQTDRSNDRFLAAYKVNGNAPTPGLDYTKPWITSTRLQSNLEKRRRYNVNLNLDFDLGNRSKIKLSNLFSSLDRDRDIREKRYDLEGTRLRYTQTDATTKGSILSNIVQGDHTFWNSTLSWGLGRSESRQKTPYEHILGFRMNTPFRVDLDALGSLPPYLVSSPEYVDESDLGLYYLYDGTFNSEHTNETEYSAWLDWKVKFHIGERISGFIKAGGKYRQKDRERLTERHYRRLDQNADLVFANMPDLARSDFSSRYAGIGDFLDNDFKSRDFLNNKYDNLHFDFALDRGFMSDFYNRNTDLYRPILTTRIQKDYEGYEKMAAGYLMAEINLGRYITFIPGVRYDHTYMRYKAYSGTNIPDDETQELSFDYEKTSDSNRFGYWLPQIHLRVKPASWADVRLAYTETLSRPDYDLLAPRTLIKPNINEVTYSRTNLKPALSRNYDVILTFYKPELGLLTIGGFYKKIENFIYTRSAYLLEGTATDPANFGLAASLAGSGITYPLNSPHDATIKGLEIDVQTQLRRLPGAWKGIVIGANLSLMDSEMGYFETVKSRVKNPAYQPGDGSKPFVPVNSDTIYYDRLLKQPSLLMNVSLGYDYKGFSGRISYSYQDNILISEQHRADAADVETTRAFSKWDIQLKQRITDRLNVYASVSNLFNRSDRKKRKVTGYPSNVECYGSTFYVGVRYDLFK